jgi:Fe2+ or Zn2+ uptake regulation protein
MNKPGSIAGQLSELGYWLTPQRAMILSAIEDSDNHISAEEIYVQIAAEYL